MHEPEHDEDATAPPPAGRRRWRLRWRHLLAIALALLAASEVLWRWQSWPVRALLDGTPAAATPGAGR